MRFYRETLRVEREALGANHGDVVLTMQHIGQVHQQRGELNQAINYFEEALRIQRRTSYGAPCGHRSDAEPDG
jgi:tetratricopeptide (TPR) repeat protein